MSIFPNDSNLSINEVEIVEETEIEDIKEELPIFKEYKLDYETGELITNEQGENIILEKDEALKIWIWKVLQTNKYKYKIYTNNYGNELETLVGKGYSKELVDSEVSRYLEECLLANPYIKSLDNVSVEFEGSKLKTNIKVKTIYGEVKASV
ncbi:terminase (plasmid) [Clostridiaceae bacterium 14S0207]|nr:terminase [Clostridiaceae bacterium 14S0207]